MYRGTRNFLVELIYHHVWIWDLWEASKRATRALFTSFARERTSQSENSFVMPSGDDIEVQERSSSDLVRSAYTRSKSWYQSGRRAYRCHVEHRTRVPRFCILERNGPKEVTAVLVTETRAHDRTNDTWRLVQLDANPDGFYIVDDLVTKGERLTVMPDGRTCWLCTVGCRCTAAFCVECMQTNADETALLDAG